ncbi:MAG: hypothetical protein ACREI2_03545 [Nitrospiraceae bacterium]
MSLAQEKLEAIASYLTEHISNSSVTIQPLLEASPVYILIVKTPHHQRRVNISRPLIEDENHSVAKVRKLLVRDKLDEEIQRLDREEYTWIPV